MSGRGMSEVIVLGLFYEIDCNMKFFPNWYKMILQCEKFKAEVGTSVDRHVDRNVITDFQILSF